MSKLPPNEQEQSSASLLRTLSDEEIDFLEQQIPAQAVAATQAAFWATLTRGESVLCALGNQLYEIFPDGSRQLIKTLPENLSLPVGTKIVLK